VVKAEVNSAKNSRSSPETLRRITVSFADSWAMQVPLRMFVFIFDKRSLEKEAVMRRNVSGEDLEFFAELTSAFTTEG
jgi:hypothetical protein